MMDSNTRVQETFIIAPKKKRINTRRKGQRVESIAADELRRRGEEIAFKTHSVKIGKFWKAVSFGSAGCDIVSVFNKTWTYLWCGSTMSHFAEERDKIAAWAEKNLNVMGATVYVEYWVRVQGTGARKATWRKFVYFGRKPI